MVVHRVALAVVLASVAALPAAAQQFKPKPSPLQADVDKAVNKALGALKGMSPGGPYHKGATGDEMLLYALVHAGVPKDDPVFQQYLKLIVDRVPAHTYSASLAAMCLAELDKAGYQWKLAHIAQFLADNQCENGQWSYGEEVPLEKKTITPTQAPKAVATGPGNQVVKPATIALYGTELPRGARRVGRSNTMAVPGITIKQRARGPKSGDNSNSQYAALGLRACASGSVFVEKKVIRDAMNWWEGAQSGDGGWTYGKAGTSWGSMTAGGVGAVVIYNWMLRKPWQGDRPVKKGMEWLSVNWDVTKNPKRQAAKGDEKHHTYYLYGLERVGMLYGSDMIGAHDWFDEGAKFLLQNQQADGSWQFQNGRFVDTCFAVLFLRRATKVLPKVYTG